MKKIELFTDRKGDVTYDIIFFPDGERHIKLTCDIDRKDWYIINCRIRNGEDLFILAQLCDILNRMDVVWELRIWYLMSMRMDRVINFNESFSLKVVASIINALNPRCVGLFEAHSQRSLQLLNHSFDIRNTPMIEFMSSKLNKSIFCFPDKGAAERYREYEQFSNIVLSKKRDLNTGKILGMEVTRLNILDEQYDEIVVLDDLCDGGSTFILCAEKLRELYPDKKLILYVTHAVNIEGLKRVSKVYNEVHISESYSSYNGINIDNLFVHTINLI